MDAFTRAARVKFIAFDVDGVMTDGSLIYTSEGTELKTFNVQDGQGIKLAQRAGIDLAIITGRNSPSVTARAADLGITQVYQGVTDKRGLLGSLLEKQGQGWPAAAFMGDDLMDLSAMIRCGMAIAPANAHVQVKARSHLVTQLGGGKGAVREAIEFILTAQGKLDELFATFLEP